MFFYAWVIIALWGFWCGDFLSLIAISICDIDMLMILSDYLAYLSASNLLLPWLSCSFWHVCSHCCMFCLSYCWLSCLYIILIILEHPILARYSSRLSYFLLSLCVDLDDIHVLCMTALLLCDCMLLVCVGRTPIPLPSTLWFRSFPSFQFLLLQVWGFVCVCFSNRAKG